MKILRIRRGYTTNSSAYTEWLPPPPETPAAGQSAQGAAPAATPATPAASAAGTGPAVPAATVQPVSSQPASPLGGNALVIGGLAGALVVVFAIERLIRRLRRKSANEPDE